MATRIALRTMGWTSVRGSMAFRPLTRSFSTPFGKVLTSQDMDAIVPTLEPPVANKMLYDEGFLKVMVVGGPNIRNDYHLQSGEEFFFQMKGTLTLDVVMNGKFQKIRVPEGYCCVLPSHIPHSPQREAHSVGVVVERMHEKSDQDGMHWYHETGADKDGKDVDASGGVYYEEYFHCTDLGTQLIPVIARFKDHSTGAKSNDSIRVANPPIKRDDNVEFTGCIKFDDWLAERLSTPGPHTLFDAREFKVHVLVGDITADDLKSLVSPELNTFLWQHKKQSTITLASAPPLELEEGAMVTLTDGLESISAPMDSVTLILQSITQRGFNFQA